MPCDYQKHIFNVNHFFSFILCVCVCVWRRSDAVLCDETNTHIHMYGIIITNIICVNPSSSLHSLSSQVNFLACQFFALAAAFWFRLYLSPGHANPLIRHAVATLLGISFLIFCFGWYCITQSFIFSTVTQWHDSISSTCSVKICDSYYL